MEMLKSLIESGYIPSYCTACYRNGRTGDRFMEIAKSGQINVMCEANALMTLKEFLLDYADDDLRALGDKSYNENFKKIRHMNILNLNKEKILTFLKWD